MKIKKLVALALASTMVFSMAACGDKKSDAKSSNETVEKVVEAFGEFVKEQDSDFSYDSNMTMKMEGNGQTVTMEMAGTSVSYDGVTYTKSTTKTIMDKESQEVVEESYDIKKEDGSLISATKTSLDEEWDVEEYDAEDVETSEDEMDDFDVEAIKKDAKIETKGDNAIVTMEIAADKVGMDADELMMMALDAGADDFSEEDDMYEILTDPDAFEEVRSSLEKSGVPMLSAEVTMIPQNYVSLTDEEGVKNLRKTLDLLDADDDVQSVYTNWEEYDEE